MKKITLVVVLVALILLIGMNFTKPNDQVTQVMIPMSYY